MVHTTKIVRLYPVIDETLAVVDRSYYSYSNSLTWDINPSIYPPNFNTYQGAVDYLIKIGYIYDKINDYYSRENYLY